MCEFATLLPSIKSVLVLVLLEVDSFESPNFPPQRFSKPFIIMSTPKDSVSQSDVNLMKREPDGSFKRADSSFRDIIEKGGKFAPEEGMSHWLIAQRFCLA